MLERSFIVSAITFMWKLLKRPKIVSLDTIRKVKDKANGYLERIRARLLTYPRVERAYRTGRQLMGIRFALHDTYLRGRPDLYMANCTLPSARQLTPDMLPPDVKCIIFDKDNTLTLPNKDEYVDVEMAKMVNTFIQTYGPHRVYILSNADDLPDTMLGLTVLKTIDKKPVCGSELTHLLKFHGDVDIEQCAIVGDRIFTDVLLGRFTGMYVVKVLPLVRDGFFMTLLRGFESGIAQLSNEAFITDIPEGDYKRFAPVQNMYTFNYRDDQAYHNEFQAKVLLMDQLEDEKVRLEKLGQQHQADIEEAVVVVESAQRVLEERDDVPVKRVYKKIKVEKMPEKLDDRVAETISQIQTQIAAAYSPSRIPDQVGDEENFGINAAFVEEDLDDAIGRKKVAKLTPEEVEAYRKERTKLRRSEYKKLRRLGVMRQGREYVHGEEAEEEFNESDGEVEEEEPPQGEGHTHDEEDLDTDQGRAKSK